MPELFTIETDRVELNWAAPTRRLVPVGQDESNPGQLRITPRRSGLVFGAGTRRSSVPETVSTDPAEVVGPRLFEETDYTIYARSKSSSSLALEVRDPTLIAGINRADNGRVLHGIINFGSQVGLSEFTLTLDGRPEFTFAVEVFPSKLDYRSDYAQLLAEVQEILTGLALEYLRSTYNLGTSSRVKRSSHLEWLTLLRHIAAELDQAIAVIAHRPQRALSREPELTRAERVRRPDAAVRRAISRAGGTGPLIGLGNALQVRQQLPSSTPRPSLNTPEHRWLAAQLVAIRRRLADLRRRESHRAPSANRDATVRELDSLIALVARLSRSEPIAGAIGTPPSGFASLPLLRAPGYREAYRACLLLSLGLRIEGDAVRLALKDISKLYEYWCLLALLRTISEETHESTPAADLIEIRHEGVRVRLERGQQRSITYQISETRSVTVTYNPRYLTQITPQQPDIVVAIEDRDWPAIHLILDAKYRLDATPQYVERYGSPGPPEDAINVLHRYRDAILALDDTDATGPKRTVVQAAALFPFRETEQGRFEQTRLWHALERVGIGALPFLPTETEYVRLWLRANIRAGSWSLADRAIPHRSGIRAAALRASSAEPVLIGVLRTGDEMVHLQWIIEARTYYMPLFRSQSELRQYATKYVALYSPAILRSPGAITHCARVAGVEVLPRGQIETPWTTSRNADALYVMYRLEDMRRLPRPIINEDGARVSTHRWTTKLALDRGTKLTEILLETEAEWRLYETLTARGTEFRLSAGALRFSDGTLQPGRAWFVGPGGSAQYRGAAGFLVRVTGAEMYIARPSVVADRIGAVVQK